MSGGPSSSAVIDEFINYVRIERNLSERTVAAYASDLAGFHEWSIRTGVDILQADHMRSPAARGPEQLANAVGGSDRLVFDFQAMAKLLQAGGRAEPLPARRRQRHDARLPRSG